MRNDQLLLRDVRPRSMITISDQLEKQGNTVPGQRIFRPAEFLWSKKQQTPRPNVAIVGDSIVGGIKRRDINRETKGNPVTIEKFRGPTMDELESYVIPSRNRQMALFYTAGQITPDMRNQR